MKKLTFLLVALLCASGVFSAEINKIYLDAGGSSLWDQSEAKFGVMFSNDESSAFTAFMTKNIDGIYEAEVPAGTWTMARFMRYANTASTPAWADFWNKTCILEYGAYDLFTVQNWDECSEGEDLNSDGVWSQYVEGEGPEVDTEGKIYLTFGPNCAWWTNDNAMFGAIFRTDYTEAGYGLFTPAYFTLADAVNNVWEGDIPTNEEPWVSVQFLRYDPATLQPTPAWADFWNGTVVIDYTGTNNCFKIETSGAEQRSCDGSWMQYPITSVQSTPDFDTEILVNGLNVSLIYNGEANVEVYGIGGKLITSGSAEGKFDFNVNNSGIYIVRINGTSYKVAVY
ncbi:MAG: T9SS type A sorting domain-containing protein [Bacteroidia bacterium]|nr:T9SS type A sorting domain-containing protein [Bacteroidia bacterium]